MDATAAILALWNRLARNDIQAIMLGGSVISWFNVIDIQQLHEQTGLPRHIGHLRRLARP
ncbi:DUF99 family protein [Methanogenium cariaci]|uniref:endonuclease dU n=1 Tax=Methanogenium cariaci TaxID=2197 RepID=UPI001FDF51EC|nr:DUF99 family protein [Methanogenium cariaci]